MALTNPEIESIARVLTQRIYVLLNATATSDFDELKAAIQKIDQGMNATTTVLATARPGVVMKTAFWQEVQTVAPSITAQEGGVALALWALHEVGLLDLAGGG